jgi:DHA1 family multidrug resistance protein-like MFS transporter
MRDTLREAPFGQLVRYITRNRYFQYPEEMDGFEIPEGYGTGSGTQTPETEKEAESLEGRNSIREKLEQPNSSEADLEQQFTRPSTLRRRSLNLQRTETLPWTNERLQVERSLELEKTLSRPIAPTKTADGVILVDWYTTDDPTNPQNWASGKKALVASLIW